MYGAYSRQVSYSGSIVSSYTHQPSKLSSNPGYHSSSLSVSKKLPAQNFQAIDISCERASFNLIQILAFVPELLCSTTTDDDSSPNRGNYYGVQTNYKLLWWTMFAALLELPNLIQIISSVNFFNLTPNIYSE